MCRTGNKRCGALDHRQDTGAEGCLGARLEERDEGADVLPHAPRDHGAVHIRSTVQVSDRSMRLQQRVVGVPIRLPACSMASGVGTTADGPFPL